jgi:hypothetical protein
MPGTWPRVRVSSRICFTSSVSFLGHCTHLCFGGLPGSASVWSGACIRSVISSLQLFRMQSSYCDTACRSDSAVHSLPMCGLPLVVLHSLEKPLSANHRHCSLHAPCIVMM